MRYLGSKTLLLNEIFNLITEFKGGVFCDPFGGIGTVGSFMKKNGFHVMSGDILNFAHFFQYSLIERNGEDEFTNLKRLLQIENICDIESYLNEQYVVDGWIVVEYSDKRKFFTYENACRIQGCLNCIENWYNAQVISETERKIFIASLINSFDKVANTAGTYYGYLKKYDRRALKNFQFTLLPIVAGPRSYCCKMDAIEMGRRKCDVLYLDPPYNSRDYSRYYHLPETIAMGVIPKPKGKSGVYHANNTVSEYNKRDKAFMAFENLIKHADANCILFHYTDNGLIDMKEARKILDSVGAIVEERYLNCKGYNTSEGTKENRHHIIKICM